MKKSLLTLALVAGLAFGTIAELTAADIPGASASQVIKKKKASASKSAVAKKYVPSTIGDCFIGERIRIPNTTGIWCEITFYPNGTCELKTENSSLKGKFSGTVKGAKYNISVTFNNGEEYDFIGTKNKLVADDGLVKYIVEAEM